MYGRIQKSVILLYNIFGYDRPALEYEIGIDL